jgi:hypothetical protein
VRSLPSSRPAAARLGCWYAALLRAARCCALRAAGAGAAARWDGNRPTREAPAAMPRLAACLLLDGPWILPLLAAWLLPREAPKATAR